MAGKEPNYFYHPVVGNISPATLGLYLSRPSAAARFSFSLPQAPESSPPVSAPIRVPPPSLPVNHLDDTLSLSHPLIPERKPMSLIKSACCAVTDEILPTNQMIRFVISPDKRILPDLTHKLPGVFLWVKADRHVIKKAIWRNSFASKTRENVIIPENLLEMVETGLERLAIQTLNMAKRAGDLQRGFTKVEEALRAHEVGLYIVARNARENGREKLERLAGHQEIPVLDNWTIEDLSTALGEENVVHLSMKKGGLAQNLVELITKLKAVKSDNG